MPDWYLAMIAAQRLNCSPWELETVPSYWRHRALMANAAEADARKRRDKSGKRNR